MFNVVRVRYEGSGGVAPRKIFVLKCVEMFGLLNVDREGYLNAGCCYE